MKNNIPILTAITVALAYTASAQESILNNSDVQYFIEIMASNGCRVTEAQAQSIFEQNGMSMRDAIRISEDIAAAGYGSWTANEELVMDAPYCVPANN